MKVKIGNIKIKSKLNIGEVKSGIKNIFPELENLEITPMATEQNFKSNKYGYDNVKVNAIESEELNIIPSIETQVKEGSFNKVTVEAIETEELTIIPDAEEQVKEGLFDKVTVKAIETQELSVTPSKDEQEYNGMFDKVTIKSAVEGEPNLSPENIKEGTSIFGVNGTLSNKPNVFVQQTEPETKEGIWIKGTGDINKVVVEKSLAGSEGFDMTTYTKIPFDTRGACASVGTDIYMFGTAGLSTQQAYKYDTLTDTYTALTDNYYSNGSTAIAVGTDIYIFGSSNSSYYKTVRKYNTLTNTYTALTACSYTVSSSASVLVGNYIYFFGSTESSKTAFRYNINDYTSNSRGSVPTDFRYGKVASVGTDVYLFGGKGKSNAVYKYDTITNTYTTLTDAPFSLGSARGYPEYDSVVAVDTDIYIFSTATNAKATYRFDTLTGTYTQLDTNPILSTAGMYSAKVENKSEGLIKIYFLGTKEGSAYTISNKAFEDKSFVIIQAGNDYKTQLYTNEEVTGRLTNTFSDAFYNTTEGGNNYDLPAYYGNGSEWVQIR